VSDPRAPLRLSESPDTPFELVEALELGRADLPPPDVLDDVAKNLVTLQASKERALPPSVRPVAAGAAASFKLLLAAVVAAASVGGAVRLFRSSAPAARAPAAAPEPKPSEEPVVPHRARTATTTAPSSSSGDDVVEPPPKSEPATRSPEPRGAAPAPATTAASAVFPDAPGSAEVGLLDRANHALGSDPAAALQLTQEHAREFPAGALTQESEFIAIEALLALGRTAEADARIDRFRKRFPGSAHIRRLDMLRGTDDVP